MPCLRLLTFCFLLLLGSPGAFAADIFRLWHGVGIQGTQSEWSTEVDLREVAPTVRYPSLKCSGDWQPLGVLSKVYEYREIITVGRDICIDGYVKVFLLNKKRMAIEYREFRDGPIIAKSVVFRGPHHDVDVDDFMINVTREFIEATAKE
jgi:hypothetical protein